MPIGSGLRRAAWSHLPAPVDISATNVSSTGGTGTITGLNFVNGCTATVNINGTPTSLTVTFINSQQINYTLAAGSYAASTGTGWDLTVTNPDGQFDLEPIFQIVTTSDPQTILGTALLGWYKADAGVTQASNLVSQWNDQTSNANHLTASGSAKPTYNAASSNGFNAKPTLTFDGVANAMTSGTGPNLGGTTNTFFVYIVARLIGATVGKTYLQINGNGAGNSLFNMSASTLLSFRNLSGTVATASVAANPSGAFAAYGVMAGTGANAEVASLNVGNMTEITGTTGNGAEPATASAIGPVYLGATTGTTAFANFEVAEIVIANKKPNSTDLLSLYQYFNFKYSIDPAMVFTRALDTLVTTGTESRIAGSGFNSTTSVKVVVSGTPTSVTSTYLNTGSVSLSGLPSLSAGQYDLIINNGNSNQALTVSNALTATATKKPDTILGRKLIVWGRGDQVALNGSNISAYTDLACVGNAIIQATAANQPANTLANANFANQPTATYTGTPQQMSRSAVQFDSGTHDEFALVVYRDTTATGTQYLVSTPDGLRNTSVGGGKPLVRPSGSGTGAAWGSTVTLTTAACYFYNQFAGTGLFNSGINVALVPSGWGTEQTTVNQTGNTAATNNILNVGSSGGANYYTGDIAEVIVCDGIPSAGQLTDLATYLARY